MYIVVFEDFIRIFNFLNILFYRRSDQGAAYTQEEMGYNNFIYMDVNFESLSESGFKSNIFPIII